MLELKFWMLDFSQDHRVNDSLEENIGRLQHSYKLNKIATSLQMGKKLIKSKGLHIKNIKSSADISRESKLRIEI